MYAKEFFANPHPEYAALREEAPAVRVRNPNGPLSLTVITELLGVPVADRDQFRMWTMATIRAAPSLLPVAAGAPGRAAVTAVPLFLGGAGLPVSAG